MKYRINFFTLSIGILLGILISGVFLLSKDFLRNKQQLGYSIISPTSSFSKQSTIFTLNDPLEDSEKININTATITELMTLSGIGHSKAQAIIDFRTKYGLFESTKELSYVTGIGDNLLDSIQDEITIGK